MTTLNRDAARAAPEHGARCATDVTGFGLLGHLYQLAKASGSPRWTARRCPTSAVPYLDGAPARRWPAGTSAAERRNLDWVRPQLQATLDEDELLLLADAQTSGGLLVPGELPGHPVIGRLLPFDGTARLRVR